MSSKGAFYLFISVVTYAINPIFEKTALTNGVNPIILSLFQIFFGFIFVLMAWSFYRKKKHLIIEHSHIKDFFIIGVLVAGIGTLLGIFALQFTTATSKSMMQGLYAASTLVASFLMLNERLPKSFFPIFIAIFAGSLMLTSNGFAYLPNKGDLILYLTIPLIGFTNAYAKKTMSKTNSLTISLGRYFFGTLFLTVAFLFIGTDKIDTLGAGVFWVMLSGFIGAVRLVTYYRAIELEGPTIASTGLNTAPVLTAFTSFIFLGENFIFVQIIGLEIVIFASVFLTRIKAHYQKII